MSRFTRPLLSVRLGAQPSIRAGPSRIPDRTPRGDSYLAVRAFFTRQASVRFRLPSSGSPRWPSPHRYGSSQAGTNRPSPADITPKPAIGTNSGGHAQDYTPFIRRLIHQSGSLTHNSPNRPTKDELLAAAGSWFERLGIRLKWFTIRGWRRFNTDDLSAFTSWFVVGNSESHSKNCSVSTSLT
jgi:distribution and morphology protein 31